MTFHHDNPKRRRPPKTQIKTCATNSGKATAQIIPLKTDRLPERRAPNRTSSLKLERLLAALRTEVMIAAAISEQFGDTLDRFQNYVTAMENEIARGENLHLEAAVLKQTAQLRAAVLAASADLQRVLPGAIAHICEVQSDRSDLVYF